MNENALPEKSVEWGSGKGAEKWRIPVPVSPPNAIIARGEPIEGSHVPLCLITADGRAWLYVRPLDEIDDEQCVHRLKDDEVVVGDGLIYRQSLLIDALEHFGVAVSKVSS